MVNRARLSEKTQTVSWAKLLETCKISRNIVKYGNTKKSEHEYQI